MPGFPLARGSAWAGGRDHTPSRVPQRWGTTSCREVHLLTYAATRRTTARLASTVATLRNPHAHKRTNANAHTLTRAARAEMTTLLKVDTKCTAPSLVPTVNGNKVRSLSTHGHLSAAQGSSTNVSRSDIRLIQHFDSSLMVWSGGSS
jgi:hypothetical protein